jgi:hypothetical protein
MQAGFTIDERLQQGRRPQRIGSTVLGHLVHGLPDPNRRRQVNHALHAIKGLCHYICIFDPPYH